MKLTCVELCAGAGGQALGLEMAKFEPLALVEINERCRETLRLNRPHWNIIGKDVKRFNGLPYRGVDLVAGGLPCPPFSVAGKHLGPKDPRDLFPAALRLIREIQPKAVMIENVAGFLAPRFSAYRDKFRAELRRQGYVVNWRIFNTADFGVPQTRRRVIIVALKRRYSAHFRWPRGETPKYGSVGEAIFDLMVADGWSGARTWKKKAQAPAPTIVGGSTNHGGADLGPSGSRKAWALMGVNGSSVADAPPPANFKGMPRLTVKMVKRLQGLPDDWDIVGSKTETYRQVGNALPPALAHAVARNIRKAIKGPKRMARSKR